MKLLNDELKTLISGGNAGDAMDAAVSSFAIFNRVTPVAPAVPDPIIPDVIIPEPVIPTPVTPTPSVKPSYSTFEKKMMKMLGNDTGLQLANMIESSGLTSLVKSAMGWR